MHALRSSNVFSAKERVEPRRVLDPDIPQSARELIQRHLPTMDHVEILMLLRNERAQSLPAQRVATLIRKPEEMTATCLEALVAAGLAAQLSDGGYRYAPRDDAVDDAAESLMRLYNERPVTLVKLLYERPPTAVNTFADAFKLRKDS